MSLIFEELDSQASPIGEISLRRRSDPRLGGEVIYEVKLGEEFLMSSLFFEAEVQLSTLALHALSESGYQDDLDIVIGGLGLGYTAAAALDSDKVASVVVVEIMQAVIDWHQRSLVPLGKKLSADKRCSLHREDFFALASSESMSFAPATPDKQVHAILLDIDHSPSHWLAPSNQTFYSREALTHLSNKLHSGGIFGLWSNDLPDEAFTQLLNRVFASSQAHVVRFPNPYTKEESTNTVYLARKDNE